MGFDPMPRAPLELPAYYRNAKDSNIVCKQHGNVECKACFNWKKNITKLHKEAKKQAKKAPGKTTNLY
ncbi:hypothetical protein A1Q2_02287 [Trichosporon asahii var. asahii CBS 8904]|uniref:Uncharacterized protein n=2 Tax=Trichosporon asahii var. asahii TaxID=189963 RepID=K1VH03_TRIAC|nr:hypothetical protein A1Q1_07525 [Trichosporon asahii var. asahii CBS 2479]EJT51247.1 hypothetical protein A1Q1_07525 [Trichosporon asahii var. asahii CBS 2479]EKD03400.1 hypothetical protein A1Q2_02287 [Trichosporon asahii var. asahii CBS 8904]